MIKDPFTILEVLDDAILSKKGQISVAFKLREPDCYSLSSEDFDKRDILYSQAFSNMPEKTWIHKQDVFLKRNYIPENESDSFISKAEREHFNGREYLEHICIIVFGITDLKSLQSSYQKNPFAYKENLHKEDAERLSEFFSSVNAAVTVINSIDSQTMLNMMTANEIKDYIETYANFFTYDNSIKEPFYSEQITAGNIKGKYFSLCDDSFFPSNGYASTFIEDEKISMKDDAGIYMSMFEGLGIHLFANHVYNQYLYFEGDVKLREDLDRRRRLFGANKRFDSEVERKADEIKELQQEVMKEKSSLVLCHFNIMAWDTDEEKLMASEKKIREVFAKRNFKYLEPDGTTHLLLHMASFPGQESGLTSISGDAHRYLFILPLPTAMCFFIHYSSFKSDKEGVFFNDRLFQTPLRVDIWDSKRKYMDARNAMVIASTGGGKSSTALNIIQQLIEQDYIVVIVEFGNSFKNLCKLYSDMSMHIEYDGTTPLGINPFDLEGEELDNDKVESLSNIIQRFWRHILVNKEDTEIKTSLDTLISDYYRYSKEDHCFVNFYNYIKNNFNKICGRYKDEKIAKYFDLDSFLHNCSDFLPGKRYENIVKPTQDNELSGKKLIVFELSGIRENQFLSSLVMSILFDVINLKILSDKSKRGYLIFDEYAETAKMTDKAADTSIHSTVAYCYQTIRKQNGAVMTILQTPSQLPHGNEKGASDTDNIIANTQLLIVLPTTSVVHKDIIKYFKIENKAHINLMETIENRFYGERPYSEIFLRFQEKKAIAVRSEFSREKFLAYQTDGEITTALDMIERVTKSREKAISIYKLHEKELESRIKKEDFDKVITDFCQELKKKES